MEETGFVRFPGNLDPRAQEFRPRNTNVFRPHQVYYPFVSPPFPANELQVVPFCCDGGVGFSPFSTFPAYVSASTAAVVRTPPVSPPSATASRALALSSVPSNVTESTVRRELEVFGEVRGVQMERICEGIVAVHFYDLRHAQTALREIRDQHMQHQTRIINYHNALLLRNSGREGDNFAAPVPPPARGLISGCPVWAQFIIPASNAFPDGQNQGTIVIFNLDPEVSTGYLKEIFEYFGPVKEFRGTPSKKHQRFVEFFDIRDAAKALVEMNGKEINGRNIVIEFSRPGGYSRKFFNSTTTTTTTSNSRILTYPLQPPPPPPPPPPPCTKKASRSKGNPNGNNVSKSGNVSPGIEEKDDDGSLRKNGKKQQQQQQQPPRSRPWKSRQSKKFDTRFLINQDAIVESNCRDSRTTVMIKNIPNKYSQKLLLNMLDNHCIHCNEQIAADGTDHGQPMSSFDFVYLPIDFNNKCNVGYGFVNMTSPQATLRLYKAFHLQHWEVFNSRKICEVTYARVQGLEALKEHFKNSKFPSEMDHYLPVVFSPPRDGRQLTEPLTIVGQPQQHPIIIHASDSDGCSTSNGGDTAHDDNDEDHAHHDKLN